MDDLRYQVDLLTAINERIQADDRMYRLVCDTSDDAYLYINMNKGFIKSLGNFEKFFPGVTITNLNDISKLYSFVEEQSVLLFRELLYVERKNKSYSEGVFKFPSEDKFIECKVNVIFDDSNKAVEKIIRFKDVTMKKSQNDDLIYMAYYDILTGLYNRNYFVKLLSDYIERAQKENSIISLMLINLDDFKSINDCFGIVVGDEIIQEFGFLLNEFSSENVLVSHFSSDLFCIAIYEPGNHINADYIYKCLKEKTKKALKLCNGNDVMISFGVGVAEYPEAATTSIELINCLQVALLKAKNKGRGEIVYFDALILNDFMKSVTLDNKLKEAVLESNFFLNFQPQFYSNDKKLRGVEALIRWKDNDGEMIPPGLFIPLAEKNGTIIPIGKWVIEESIRSYSLWRKRFDKSFILSLNISALQLRCDDFVDELLSVIDKNGIEPGDIEIEITESVFIEDFKDVCRKLMKLRDFGMRIALDDFGTGFSSLSYLRKLPIDSLKIDKSFVDYVNSDDNSRIMIESIVFMSRKLGYETIAEGVEDKKQYDYLKKIGSDCIQGYFFSRPLNKDGIEELLMMEY